MNTCPSSNSIRVQEAYLATPEINLALPIWILCLFLPMILLIFPTHTLAATGINKQINFQGKVVNSNGTNVANGNYDFVFSIYTVASGGTAIWTESHTGGNQVTVTDGIFRVSLGSITALPGSIDFNTDNIYLGINFNNDGEMTPRIQFTAVPYAFNALKVAGLTVTDTTGTFTLAAGKTFTVNNTLTFSGTDSTSFTFPSTTGGTVITSNATNQSITTGLTISGATTSINASSNFDTNINTGTSTGTITIGNSSSTALKLGKFTTANGILYISATDGTVAETAASTGAQCLQTTGAGLAPVWGACATGGGITTVRESDSSPSVGSLTTLEFGPATNSSDEFIVTDQTGGVARIVIGTQVGKLNEAETVTGGWTFNTVGTTFTTAINANGGLTTSTTDTNLALTVNGAGDYTFAGDSDSNFQINATPTTDATFNSAVITLNPTGTGSTGTLQGLLISQSDNANTGVYDSLLKLENLKTPEITTNGLYIEHNAASGTLTNAINITNTAGTLTTGLSLTGTFTNLISHANFSVSNAGNITTAGTLAVNGDSITADGTTLTINAAGAVDIQDNLTADQLTTDVGGVSIAASQSYTGAGAVTLSSGGSSGLTLDSASNTLTIAASDTILTASGLTTFNTSAILSFSGDITVSGGDVLGANSASIDLGEATTGALTFTAGTTGDFVFTADADTNLQINYTSSTDDTINIANISITDNAGASSGTLYGLSIINNDNSTNTGVPDALARLANANAAETVSNGLLIEQTAAGTLTNGIQITGSAGTITSGILIADGAGTITTGLTMTGTFTNLIDTPNFDVSNAGAVTAVGVNAGTGLLQGAGGLTITGATISLNASSNFDTNINTGTSTGTITIGNSSSTALKLGKFTTANGILYISATDGTVAETAASTGAQCLQTTGAGLAPVWGACGSGGATAWDAIGDPTGSGAIAMGNTTQTLDWVTPATATALDGLTVTITNASTTDTTTQRAFVVANKDDAATTGTVETLAEIENRDTNETVTNGLVIEQTGSAGTITNAINILETAGTITTAINIGNNIGTGIALGTGLTTGISVGSGGITIASGALAVNSGSITSTGNITLDPTSTVIINTADTFQTDDVTAPASSNLTLSTVTAGAIVLQPLGSGATGDVQIGAGGTGSTTPDLLKLDVKSTALDPTGANGAMYYNANTNKFRCFENDAWKDCDTTGAGGGGKTLVRMTADVSNSTTTGANVTGLEMTVNANTTYSFNCYLIADAAATTTGIQISMNGPASPTQFTAKIHGFSASGTSVFTNINAYENYQANTASAGTTRTVFVIEGVLKNGANAGTLIPRFRSEVAGSAVNIRAGSWCEVF